MPREPHFEAAAETDAPNTALDGHECEQAPGGGDGQGGLACHDSWGRKESDTTERLNWTEPQKLEQLPKVILNPWILQSLLMDTALPFRETRSRSINQSTGASSTNQETSQGTNPTPSTGADSTAKDYDLENPF